ncbi:hypothetical protein SAY86_003719 [Trapa natans]|uniref:Uncharacterized protein n=1 Tax=Trapa natans TaxID=22666 RepID=A0AAN7MSN7_TRANT|nr:hypothetical protein SAY86_003719 [Trapa natans]
MEVQELCSTRNLILQICYGHISFPTAITDELFQQMPPDNLANDVEESKWYRWVNNHLVHVLSPNIYRTPSDALESFNYITSHDRVKPNLADLAVFGVLRPIRNLESGNDMVENTPIGEWRKQLVILLECSPDKIYSWALTLDSVPLPASVKYFSFSHSLWKALLASMKTG